MKKIILGSLITISLLGMTGCQAHKPQVNTHKKVKKHKKSRNFARGKGKFRRLRKGMGQKQVRDLIGRPTDTSRYITGKSFIPYYMGADRQRIVYYYRHAGRLIFNIGGPFKSGGRLIKIINDRSEDGYR